MHGNTSNWRAFNTIKFIKETLKLIAVVHKLQLTHGQLRWRNSEIKSRPTDAFYMLYIAFNAYSFHVHCSTTLYPNCNYTCGGDVQNLE
jgi:hypothetical protein